MKEEILKKIHSTKKNLIIDGVISTEKTKNVSFPLVNQMIDLNESLFILDSKEEYINEFYEKLKQKEYNIVIINLRDLNKSEGWNFLEYPYNLYKQGKIDTSIEFLNCIGKELFYDHNEKDRYWINSAADLFTGITLGLFEDAKEFEINLSSICKMINPEITKYAKTNYLEEYFKYKSPTESSYLYASSAVFAPMETRNSIISIVKQKLSLLVSRPLLNMLLSKTTFDMNDLYRKKSAVFFINKDEENTLNSVPVIFIKQLYKILVDSNLTNKFNFILDNFDCIDYITELYNMLGAGIPRNIKFTILTRSKELLEEKYGSYIKYLSDEIHVSNSIINLNIDNFIKSIRNIGINNNLHKNTSINYPTMKNYNINTFDMITFVSLKRTEIMNQIIPHDTIIHRNYINNKKEPPKDTFMDNKTNENKISNTNIDEMIENIDKKIAQLEAEEKRINMNLSNESEETKDNFMDNTTNEE